jgi:hypothetical protein
MKIFDDNGLLEYMDDDYDDLDPTWTVNQTSKPSIQAIKNHYTIEQLVDIFGVDKIQNYLRKLKIKELKK